MCFFYLWQTLKFYALPLTASDIKTAKSILLLINPRIKSNPVEYVQELPHRINRIIILGLKADGSCESLYTCIFEMTPARLEMWNTYKTYLRLKSFTKQVPEQGVTLIGWERNSPR